MHPKTLPQLCTAPTPQYALNASPSALGLRSTGHSLPGNSILEVVLIRRRSRVPRIPAFLQGRIAMEVSISMILKLIKKGVPVGHRYGNSCAV